MKQGSRAGPTPAAGAGGRSAGSAHRLARWLLQRRLRSVISDGALQVRLPGGPTIELGDGAGQPLRVVVTDWKWCLRLALNPALTVGEAYMEGGLTLEKGDLHALADLIGRNLNQRRRAGVAGPLRWWRDFTQRTDGRLVSRRNVAHHYDLSVEFYRLFLDDDLQYSCAYFARDGLTLEKAQIAKKRHLAAKLRLAPGQTILDIGCGWGGLALFLAEAGGGDVHGVTLSTEQLAVANARARQTGRSGQARFSLTDYRDIVGTYDRIVSVGMFEHVGRRRFRAYFARIASLLEEDGVALIHSIGRAEGPGFTQPWIAKYIFPGGYIPALSEMAAAAEHAGLIITDVEVLRLHYAETIRCWRERFAARRAEIASMYDERFCRMWEFYLCISESAFRRRGHSVFQLQLAKRIDTVPLTRDYIASAERALGGDTAGVAPLGQRPSARPASLRSFLNSIRTLARRVDIRRRWARGRQS